MKVLIAADYSAVKSGNFIASVLSLGRAIVKQNGNVIFIFPREREWCDWLRSQGFTVLIASNGNAENNLDFLKKTIEMYQIDILHIHFGMYHNLIMHHVNEFKNIRVLVHDHMDFSPDKSIPAQKTKTILNSLLYQIHGISAVTVMKQKLAYYPFLRNKWYVPNGLSLERSISSQISRKEMREKLNIKEDEIMCLLLGWDLYRKGLDIAIRAVQNLIEKGYSISLSVIGSGKEPSGNVKEFLDNAGIDYKADWIHWLDSIEDMFSLYRTIDIFLSASRREAFSYGLLESISQNVPAVISDIPGTRWAEDYSKAVFYHTEDADDCAKAIEKAVLLGRTPSNCQKICSKYSIDQWIDHMIQIYSKLLSQ